MNLLHRHLFWSVLTTCLAAVGLFAFVLLVGNALKDLLGLALGNQIPLELVFELLALLVPYVAAYALPMGVLTGVLLVLGRMSAQNEITAMRAAGLSLGYIARPVWILSVLGMAAALVINFHYMPATRMAYKTKLAQALSKSPMSFIVPRTFIRDFGDVVLYVGEKRQDELRDFWVWQLDKQKRVRVFARAESGRFNFDEATNTLVLNLQRVTVERRNPDDPEAFEKPQPSVTYESNTIDLKLDNLMGTRSVQRKLAWMTWSELRVLRERWTHPPVGSPEAGKTLAERAEQLMRISISIHERMASSAAVLAFAVIAIPLGIRVSRRETSANLGVALALVMAYYFLSVVVGWADKHPAWRPDLLIWVPTALAMGIGLWLFRRVDRA